MGRFLAPPDGRLNSRFAPAMTLSTLSPDSPAFFDLSGRVKLRVTGADSFRYLNGQITNDLRKATASAAIPASLLNAKGKMSAHVFISREKESFLMDCDPELREELPARLDRYIIADDVQIEDVTEQFSIFHLINSRAGFESAARSIAANRFGLAGLDLWVDRSLDAEVRRQLSGDAKFVDAEHAEVFRIEQGVARWGRELTSEIIPVEANLEASSIDYSKGCYIGQEVISRMKMSGQTNKRLCGLVSLAPLEPGARLMDEADPAKDAGWVTSAAHSDRLGKEIALGYVKRGWNNVGTRLRAGDVVAQVTALPFL